MVLFQEIEDNLHERTKACFLKKKKKDIRLSSAEFAKVKFAYYSGYLFE